MYGDIFEINGHSSNCSHTPAQSLLWSGRHSHMCFSAFTTYLFSHKWCGLRMSLLKFYINIIVCDCKSHYNFWTWCCDFLVHAEACGSGSLIFNSCMRYSFVWTNYDLLIWSSVVGEPECNSVLFLLIQTVLQSTSF